jgi:hypothetical protein
MRGRIGESSRDRPKDDSSGLKPTEEPSVLTNSTRSDVEKESESRGPGGCARMGSLTNPNARKRVRGTRVSGEDGKGTQQGRNRTSPGFFASVRERGGLQVVSSLDMQRA